jgi:DNA-binding FadR family transcriptional regulator
MKLANPRGRDKLHLSVAGDFEARILSGALGIGEPLPSEADIARDFGVSTRSVREAIQILETKGLVKRRHGGRTTVVRDDVTQFLGTLTVTVRQLFSTDAEYLVQLMAVRRMIEMEVVDLLTSGGGAMNSDVGDALEAMRVARDVTNFTGFVDADAAFHLALVHSAGNQILSVFYDNLFGLITEVIRITSRVPTKSLEAAYAEHADIFTRIESRDGEGAKALMRDQIDNSAAYLRLAIEKTKHKDTTNE